MNARSGEDVVADVTAGAEGRLSLGWPASIAELAGYRPHKLGSVGS